MFKIRQVEIMFDKFEKNPANLNRIQASIDIF